MKKLKALLSPKGGDQKEKALEWIPLEREQALEALLEKRKHRLQIVFKHSTSCGLSAMMLRRFQQLWGPSREQADFYLLDLIRHRELSRQLAETLQVPHQSPQVIVIGEEGVREHASHGDIDGLRPGNLLKNPS